MRINSLQLVNFKNYEEAHVEFSGDVHCFFGKNGSGKTNLLEAIHYLCFTKGRFLTSDASNVKHGESHFFIKGNFQEDRKQIDITCAFRNGRRKTFSENGKEYSRFSEHIGKYPLVLIAPDDSELIGEGGEVRRKFFDTLLSQIDRDYLENLISYQAHVKQRNSLLKMFMERGSDDRDLVESYDEKIADTGQILFIKRKNFINDFIPLLQSRYDFITNDRSEAVTLVYESDLEDSDFRVLLKSGFDRDYALGRTSVGVHRDDYAFKLNGHELRKFGSQGQQKSFSIALKLAEFDYLLAQKKVKPLLLLDDIFDKLDDDRIQQLMKLVTGGSFGQIFITDARHSRSQEVLRETGVISQNFFVERGNLSVLK